MTDSLANAACGFLFSSVVNGRRCCPHTRMEIVQQMLLLGLAAVTSCQDNVGSNKSTATVVLQVDKVGKATGGGLVAVDNE